jgi:hypothetical protein
MEGKILLIVKTVKIILFVVFLMMIIWGQKQVGYVNLGVMLAGLAGLLMLLYSYNKKYR